MLPMKIKSNQPCTMPKAQKKTRQHPFYLHKTRIVGLEAHTRHYRWHIRQPHRRDPQRIFQCCCFHRCTWLETGSCRMGRFQGRGSLDRHATSWVQQEGQLALLLCILICLLGMCCNRNLEAKSNFVGIRIRCHYFFGCMHRETRLDRSQ